VKMPRRSEDKKSESLADRFNKNFLEEEEEERRESRGGRATVQHFGITESSSLRN
jgi:hypothetical protein